MNFELNEEQTLLRETLRGYLSRHWDQDRHNRGGAAARRTLWQTISSDLGLTGVIAPEELGGMGGGMVELMIVCQELGRAQALQGFIPAVAHMGTLLGLTGEATRLEQIVDGSLVAAIAHDEPGVLPGGDAVTTRWDDGKLTGTKIMVAGAPISTHLLVSAMEHGEQAYSLFLLPVDTPGTTRRDFDMIDGNPASEIIFDDVNISQADRIGSPGQGPSLHRKACDISAIAQAAEAVGMMEALIRMVVDYTSARKQFGKPLAEFQVLQHRMADMVLNLEDTRSLLYMAALGEPDGPNRDSEIARMKVHANEALRFVSQQAVQLHGGMGITDDLWVGHFFKRAMVLMAAHGGTPHYRARYEASL